VVYHAYGAFEGSVGSKKKIFFPAKNPVDARREREDPAFLPVSCAVVSVFCSGGKKVSVLHTTYVLRVPYSCGVVLVLLVLAGNGFWCYVRT
jgi:hypothetical protein